MGADRRAEAARRFSAAADALVSACRMLEEEGLPDPPVEQLLRSLDELAGAVHRWQPPGARVHLEPAGLAGPAPCHVAARAAAGQQGPDPR